MNNKVFTILCASIAVVVSVLVSSKFFTPRIAFIRSAVIVDKYKGMLEARDMYKRKIGQWQANIDTLEAEYKKSYGIYTSEMPRLTSGQKQEREESLKKQEANIRSYVTALEQKAKQEDNKLTEGVLNQVNSFIKEYGEAKGYDVILGSTLDGSILYGKEAKDITDEVLKELNDSYKKDSSAK